MITSKLPVRLQKPLSTDKIEIKTCNFGALVPDTNSSVIFRSENCVGCRECVYKYPQFFSVDEEIEVRIRKIDQINTQNLTHEFRLFQSPDEITSFVLI